MKFNFDERAYGNISDVYSHRLIYKNLHEILVTGIEANHFKKDLEAISFVSSLFSYVMSTEFLSEFTNRLRNNYSKRDYDLFASQLRILVGNLIDTVSRESSGVGVSTEYLSLFFRHNNSRNTRDFGSKLASVSVEESENETVYLRACMRVLIEFMAVSLDNSKEVFYHKRSLPFSTLVKFFCWFAAAAAVVATVGYL